MNWTTSDTINLSKLTVRIIDEDKEYVQTEGSGFLYYYKNKTYLLTAGHCVQHWNDGNLLVEQIASLDYGKVNFRTLKLGRKVAFDYKPKEGRDYAIFEIEYPNNGYLNAKRVKIVDPYHIDHVKDLFFTYGYPQINRNGHALNAAFIYPNTWELEVMDTKQKTFHQIIEGFSGSPIVSANTDNTYNFFAIQKKTLDDCGSLNSVHSTFATFFQSLLISENTPKVESTYVPQDIVDNQDYIERKVQLWNNLHFISNIEEANYTLYDFVTERVPNVQSFRYLLLASAQSGKSYELKHLAHILAKEDYAVSYIEGKNITDADIQALPQSENIEAHPTVVIIDALDEAGLGVDTLVALLNEYCTTYPTIKLVISCRQNYEIQRQLKSFTPLYLCEITIKDADAIIENRIADNVIADSLKEYIREPIAQEFSMNLFCLLQLIDRSKGQLSLPSTKAELYSLFIEKTQGFPDAEADGQKQRAIKTFLQKSALMLMMINRQSLSYDELMRIADVETPEHLHDLMPRELFSQSADSSYGFVNNAIKEYLVAEMLQQHDLAKVQGIVCFNRTSRIKPQWYNVVMLWLQLMSKRQQPLEQDIIEWITTSAKELILQCDSSSIDSHTRYVLVRNILEEHKNRGTFFSAIYTEDYKVLYKFGESNELIKYILYELQNIIEGSSIYNILCLTPYINFGKLKQEDNSLYGHLTDALFHIIERYGSQEHSGGCYYFMYLNSHFYNSATFIERLYNTIREYRNQDAVNAMAAACTRGNYADQYAEWFLQCEPHMRTTGTTFAHREPLYAVLGKVRTFDNVRLVLNHMTDPNMLRYEIDEDGYMQMLSSLLSTAYQYRKEEGMVGQVRDSFNRLMVDHPYTITPSLSSRILSEYKSFFLLTCMPDDEVYESIRKIEYFGRQSPEQQEKFRQQRQQSFNDMCNYPVFSAKIRTIASTDFDGITDTSFRVINAGFSSDAYILNFVFAAGCLRSFDREALLRNIEDQTFYANYRMIEVAEALLNKNRGIDVGKEQIEAATITAMQHLVSASEGKNQFDHHAMTIAVKLLIMGYGTIDRDVLIRLLPHYANVSIPNSESDEDQFEYSSFNLLKYAEQKLGKESIIDSLCSWVDTPETVSEPQFILFVDYLINTGAQDILKKTYDAVLRHPNPAVIELLTEHLLNNSILRSWLKADIDSLNENCKMQLLTQAIENESEAPWAKDILEKLFTSLVPFNQRRVIHLLLKAGSKHMLEYVNDHRHEILTTHAGYIFTFEDPDCLDILLSLYPYVYKTEDIMHISSSSIMVSIGNIAQQSTELLDRSISGVQAISDDLKMPILLKQIDIFRILYYQRKDVSPSFMEALESVNEIIK